MTYQHGVYIEESSTEILTPVESDAGIQVVVGTAPINLLDDPQSAVNTPIVAYSYEEAVAKLGYSEDFDKYTLCQSIYASFLLFNVAPVVFINVLDPTVHKTAVTDSSIQVNNKVAKIAVEGVLLSSLVVKSGTGTNTYTKTTDYIAAFDDDGHVTITVTAAGAAKNETTLKVTYNKLDPTQVDEDDIIGGYDASTGKYKGLECINRIYPIHNIVPGLLLAPGYSHKPNVYPIMTAKSQKINGCFNIMSIADIDTATVKVYDQANAWKNSNNYTDKNTILSWPMVKVGTKILYMSALAGALESYTTAVNSNVPFVSPSNKNFKITGTVLKDGTEVYLDIAQANSLNSQGIFTAINVNGWKSWGNETACYPGNTDVKDRFIASRMMFNWWGNSFILTYFQEVDDPANLRLIDRIVDTENIRANGFKGKSQIADAKITFSSQDNPITSILDGKIQFKQKLTTFPPAKEIVNTLEFDPSALQKSLGV